MLFTRKPTAEQNPEKKPKVAFISVYGTECGVATYNEALVEQLREHADVHVFAEYADENRSERLDHDKGWVTRCWHRTEHPKIQLINQVLKYQPDLIHFSHEYGFFMKAFMFTALVSAFKARGIPVLSTMHSVYEHLDKTVQESFNDHIVVHTNNAKLCLVQKGIESSKISMIPHGSHILDGTPESPKLMPPLWNTWGAPMLFQPGFLFHYKGHVRIINILPKLKEKYPDIHYVIQGSENRFNKKEHDDLFNALVQQAESLGVSANVSINRGFVSEAILLSYIRTSSCCVLPYANNPAHDVFATSGIARLVLGTETPLVVSNVHLFDDLQDLVPRATSDDELYTYIDQILSDSRYGKEQVSKRVQMLSETSWVNVAKQYSDLYKTLIA